MVLDKRLRPYRRTDWRDHLATSSPWKVYETSSARHEFLRCLFGMLDRVWLGGIYDSGKPHHAPNFKQVYEWMSVPMLPSRCAAGTFKKGSHQRSQGNVRTNPLIVIESDNMQGFNPATPSEKEANKASSFALIQYLRDKWKLNLRAVVDTGNKSLHAWFDHPSSHIMDCLIDMAWSHHIDEGLLTHCQALPLRMPGCIHEKTNIRAELLYLNHNQQHQY